MAQPYNYTTKQVEPDTTWMQKLCLRPMPGSDDEDGDTASGLLQNILERVSNGDSCQQNK